jgi:hypothetical protein
MEVVDNSRIQCQVMHPADLLQCKSMGDMPNPGFIIQTAAMLLLNGLLLAHYMACMRLLQFSNELSKCAYGVKGLDDIRMR